MSGLISNDPESLRDGLLLERIKDAIFYAGAKRDVRDYRAEAKAVLDVIRPHLRPA